MHHIQLSDDLFQTTQQRALEFGYANVDEYVAAVLRDDPELTPNLDHLFTPERLAIIDRATAEIEAGLGMTQEQVDEALDEQRRAWRSR